VRGREGGCAGGRAWPSRVLASSNTTRCPQAVLLPAVKAHELPDPGDRARRRREQLQRLKARFRLRQVNQGPAAGPPPQHARYHLAITPGASQSGFPTMARPRGAFERN